MPQTNPKLPEPFEIGHCVRCAGLKAPMANPKQVKPDSLNIDSEDVKQEAELKTGYIKVELDYAPRDSDKAFREWCKQHDFDCFGLDNGREAWCSRLSTYFRGASGVAYADGEPFLFYEEDLLDLEAHTTKLLNEMLDRLEESMSYLGSLDVHRAIEKERNKLKEIK